MISSFLNNNNNNLLNIITIGGEFANQHQNSLITLKAQRNWKFLQISYNIYWLLITVAFLMRHCYCRRLVACEVDCWCPRSIRQCCPSGRESKLCSPTTNRRSREDVTVRSSSCVDSCSRDDRTDTPSSHAKLLRRAIRRARAPSARTPSMSQVDIARQSSQSDRVTRSLHRSN